ncbi:fucolectin-4-like isoform X2 [Hyperolius riggenbachi]|uniref:fucolectin-4-like isoform X2 n=1 Tax=Hyperolius riggenbachi TaxID=752182 RepID=UPI0035A3BF0D
MTVERRARNLRDRLVHTDTQGTAGSATLSRRVESVQEEVYANVLRMEKRQSAKETAAARNIQKNHINLILVILLVIKVVILVILTSIQLTYINNLIEEMSHVKTGVNNLSEDMSKLKIGVNNLSEEMSRLKPGDGNVALNGKASQSSTLDGQSSAKNAIDGNLDTDHFSGSCAHTGDDISPWWRVNLLKPHKISKVNITNRGDCCWERLTGASILIGNSPENNGNNNPSCAVISSIQNSDALSFNCNNMIGQYVNIILINTRKRQPLSLCEVQVFGVPAKG